MEEARDQMRNKMELMQLYKTCETVTRLIEENLDAYIEKGNSREFETALTQLLFQITLQLNDDYLQKL